MRGGVHKCVANVGFSPTFVDAENPEKIVEAHVLQEFDADFYKEPLALLLMGFIRPERKFDSFDELVSTIRSDIETARSELDCAPYYMMRGARWLESKLEAPAAAGAGRGAQRGAGVGCKTPRVRESRAGSARARAVEQQRVRWTGRATLPIAPACPLRRCDLRAAAARRGARHAERGSELGGFGRGGPTATSRLHLGPHLLRCADVPSCGCSWARAWWLRAEAVESVAAPARSGSV